jgi:hypothetical protein
MRKAAALIRSRVSSTPMRNNSKEENHLVKITNWRRISKGSSALLLHQALHKEVSWER